MVAPDPYDNLVQQLKIAVGLLELPPDHPLKRDLGAVCEGHDPSLGSGSPHQNCRIAVFGPFNYGKSTLLNALLGEKALPIDLIPTTGAAICVRYGPELQTRIRLLEGGDIEAEGTDILKQYAILDHQRRMREDVASVDVQCPHPFLQTGVELLDLPGTNDQEAQDALVKDQLLTADLVVQVLDSRKLMTLGEREQLRDWLLDRGIDTVILVVNFLNLLQPDEQKQVMNRMRFVAQSFRAQLPAGVSNLYRVDALPALRARLKGDMAAAQRAGLSMFESALQTIVQSLQDQGPQRQGSRLVAIAQRVQQALQAKIAAVEADLTAATQHKVEERIQIQRRAQELLNQGFQDSVTELRRWLALPQLRQVYEAEATLALRQFEFEAWRTNTLKPAWTQQLRPVMEWVYKACEFFGQPRPADLWFAFPDPPQVAVPQQPPVATSPDQEIAPVAVASGLGWLMGGPLGAAVLGGATYMLNQIDSSSSQPPQTPAEQWDQEWDQACNQAAQAYLNQFSLLALAALQQYQITADRAIHCPIQEHPPPSTQQQHQLALLQSTLRALEQALRAV